MFCQGFNRFPSCACSSIETNDNTLSSTSWECWHDENATTNNCLDCSHKHQNYKRQPKNSWWGYSKKCCEMFSVILTFWKKMCQMQNQLLQGLAYKAGILTLECSALYRLA